MNLTYVFYRIINFLKVSLMLSWTMKDGRNLDRWRREDFSTGNNVNQGPQDKKNKILFQELLSGFICLVWRICEYSRRR